MKDISKEFRAEIRKRAKRNPNFIYKIPVPNRGCLYLNPSNGAGSCIVGRALTAVGANREVMKNADNIDSPQESKASHVINDSLRPEKLSVDTKTWMWATLIQESQDMGINWAMSIARADKSYPTVAREDGITL